jgi:hypothetical protein
MAESHTSLAQATFRRTLPYAIDGRAFSPIVPKQSLSQNASPYDVIARSVATKQSVTQDALIVTDCFAALAMTAWIGRFRASANFQLSIFNFQLNKHF